MPGPANAFAPLPLASLFFALAAGAGPLGPMLSSKPAAAQTQQQTSTTAAAPGKSFLAEDPAVTAMALKIYAEMRTGKVDPALLTPEMAAAATPEILAGMKPMFDTLGDPKQLKLESAEKVEKTEKSAGGTSYLYLAVFPAAQFHISLFITPDGKVGGYQLKP